MIPDLKKSIFIFFVVFVFYNYHVVFANLNDGNFEYEDTQLYEEHLDFFPYTYFIQWEFFTYDAPYFEANITGSWMPQSVLVLEENENTGWVLISTYKGNCYAYINSNRFFVPRRMGIFKSIHDTNYVSIINSQIVQVLDKHENWFLIDTYLGDMWINLDFMPPTNNLTNALHRFGNNLSVYFYNVENSFRFTYNADRVYFGASISKAPFALYIYQKAERGETNLDSVHTFNQSNLHGGSGVIRHRYRFGQNFTQHILLALNLYESDNTATRMLAQIHGTDGYRRFVQSLGANSSRVANSVFGSNMTTREAGIFARAIFDYIEVSGRYSEDFRKHLLNNQFPFLVSDYPIASKTGWTRPSAWHDMSIVYAPSPYILVVFSARNGWSNRDYADFYEISMMFQNFNRMWFY